MLGVPALSIGAQHQQVGAAPRGSAKATGHHESKSRWIID
jgi:hypothetical protein